MTTLASAVHLHSRINRNTLCDMITAALTERAPLHSTRTKTSEGYLRVLANVTRAGVSTYRKQELSGIRDNSLPDSVGVFRPLAILEAQATQDSIRMKPVTFGHPPAGFVTQNNYRQNAKGHVGSVSMLREGHLQVEMLIHDAELISKIEEGDMDVSIGTLPNVRMRREQGTFEGVPYHLRVDSPLDINHVAVVERGKGRAGESVRILESTEEEPMDQKDKDELLSAIRESREKSQTDKTGTFDPKQFEANLLESVGKIVTTAIEARDKAAADAKKAEDEKTALAESQAKDVVDRADILMKAQQVMTPDAFEKVKDKPIVDVLREALASTVPTAKDMDEPTLRGAFAVATAQRLTESKRVPTGRPTPSGSVAGPNIRSGMGYRKYLKTAS